MLWPIELWGFGVSGGNRTHEIGICSPAPYHSVHRHVGGRGGSRTPYLLIQSQALYRMSYTAIYGATDEDRTRIALTENQVS